MKYHFIKRPLLKHAYQNWQTKLSSVTVCKFQKIHGVNVIKAHVVNVELRNIHFLYLFTHQRLTWVPDKNYTISKCSDWIHIQDFKRWYIKELINTWEHLPADSVFFTNWSKASAFCFARQQYLSEPWKFAKRFTMKLHTFWKCLDAQTSRLKSGNSNSTMWYILYVKILSAELIVQNARL